MPKGGFGKIASDEELQTIQDEHNFGSEKKFLDYVQRMLGSGLTRISHLPMLRQKLGMNKGINMDNLYLILGKVVGNLIQLCQVGSNYARESNISYFSSTIIPKK